MIRIIGAECANCRTTCSHNEGEPRLCLRCKEDLDWRSKLPWWHQWSPLFWLLLYLGCCVLLGLRRF